MQISSYGKVRGGAMYLSLDAPWLHLSTPNRVIFISSCCVRYNSEQCDQHDVEPRFPSASNVVSRARLQPLQENTIASRVQPRARAHDLIHGGGIRGGVHTYCTDRPSLVDRIKTCKPISHERHLILSVTVTRLFP